MNDNAASYGQQLAVVVAQCLAGILSLFGSCSIIYIVLKRSSFRSDHEIYHRLILGLSISDVLFTMCVVLSPFLQPKDGRVGSNGTTESCTAAGIFFPALQCTSLYNCFLAFYFFSTICKGKSPQTVSVNYEKWMHSSVIGLFLVYNIAAVSLKGYNPGELARLCGTTPYPPSCTRLDDVECTRGEYSRPLGLTSMVLLIVPGLTGILLTRRVFTYVREILRQSESIRRLASSQSASQREQQVAIQAAIYSAAMANSFGWAIALLAMNQILDEPRKEMGRPAVFAFTLVASAMIPLQGLFNFLVYIRPRYTRYRTSGNRWWALQQVYVRAAPSVSGPVIRSMPTSPGESREQTTDSRRLSAKQNQPTSSEISQEKSQTALAANEITIPQQP